MGWRPEQAHSTTQPTGNVFPADGITSPLEHLPACPVSSLSASLSLLGKGTNTGSQALELGWLFQAAVCPKELRR